MIDFVIFSIFQLPSFLFQRHEITVLKAQICTFDVELEGKEKENEQLMHQGMGIQER